MPVTYNFTWGTETVDGSDDEDAADGYYRAKASTKKEKKRQEREAQRQVEVSKRCFVIINYKKGKAP